MIENEWAPADLGDGTVERAYRCLRERLHGWRRVEDALHQFAAGRQGKS